jgi:type IV secretion system protein VirB10
VIGSRAPDGPDRSPVMLAPPPRRGAGVRRLTRMPLVIGFGGACAVAAAIGYTYHERAVQAAANAQRDAEHKAEPANGVSIPERRSRGWRGPVRSLSPNTLPTRSAGAGTHDCGAAVRPGRRQPVAGRR